MKPPHGAPYTLPSAVTVVLKFSSSLPTQGWSSSGTRFLVGLMAWNSEPELYMKTSVMSPVDSRVLMRLSPSLPPGRVSTLIVMFRVLRGEVLGELLRHLDGVLAVVDEEATA